jgi:hypothetical protein
MVSCILISPLSSIYFHRQDILKYIRKVHNALELFLFPSKLFPSLNLDLEVLTYH